MSHEPEYLPEHEEPIDPWHMHAPKEGRPQVEHASHVNTTMLGIAFLVTVGTVVAVTGLIIVYFGSYAATVRAEKVETTRWAEQAAAMRRAQTATLDEGGPVEGAPGVSFAPVGEAMETVIGAYADQRADAN